MEISLPVTAAVLVAALLHASWNALVKSDPDRLQTEQFNLISQEMTLLNSNSSTPPVVKLFYPQPDTQRRDALLLTWNASAHNLAPNPITLQWAERPDGQWQNIAADLTNSGRYVWQVTPNMPYRL